MQDVGQFAAECQRVGFGAPLPISDSLLAVKDRSLDWLLDEWKNPEVIDDGVAFTECVIPNGLYGVPYFDEVDDLIQQMSKVKHERFLNTHTYGQYRWAKSNWESGDYQESPSDEKPSRIMSASELIAIGLYSDGELFPTVGPDLTMRFTGYELNAQFAESRVAAISPMKFLGCIDRDFVDNRLYSNGTGLTIGELLHTISRYPNFLEPSRESSMLPQSFLRDVCRSDDDLRALVGDAWLSYKMLALYAVLGDFANPSVADVVGIAKRFIELGLEVEVLQPYVSVAGCDVELIRSAIASGISADIVSATKGERRA